MQSDRVGSQGDDNFIAKNPPFGANFTYFLPEKFQSLKDERQGKGEKRRH